MDQHRTDDAALSVIVPAYNEQEAIGVVLDQLDEVLSKSPLSKYEIIVVDDGSSDATAQRVRDRGGATLMQHRRNRGYGAALKTGICHAHYDWICITDADGTYPNDRIPDLMEATNGSCMVVGARTADDVQYPLIRRIPKIFLRRYAEWLARAEITDMNSGLRVFRRDAAERLLHLLPDGFSFTTTITMAMLTNNFVVRFVPIGYAQRIGKSKIKPIRDTLNFLLLISRMGTYFAPFRIFMPVAMVFFALFVASATYDALVLKNLTEKSLILLTLTMNSGIFALLADMIQRRVGR